MTTYFNVNNNFRGINLLVTPFCSQIYTVTLSAATEETIAVPLTTSMGFAQASQNPTFLAVFTYSSTANVYVAVNGTAAVPAGHTFGASTSVLNPQAKICKAGDVIHVISAGTPDVCIEFYSTQEN